VTGELPKAFIDRACERELLATCIANPNIAPLAADKIAAEHFGVALHGKIFRAIGQVLSEGKKLDEFALDNKLSGEPDYDSAGGLKSSSKSVRPLCRPRVRARSDGQSLRAEYLVGCDGGRSLIRKAAGIEFPGWDPTTSWLIAEVEMAEEPKWGFHQDALGIHALSRLENGGPVRVVLTERQIGPASEPTLRDLSEALIAVYGTDYRIHSPTWISRFTDMTRQAAAYRDRRVLLAGDAAHVHPPVGGQGLNIGVQDAVNLGWKLAQVVKRTSPENLLDTYHAERHPVAARVLRNTMAQIALRRTNDRTKALGDTVSELLGMNEPRRRLAAEMSGLGIHYDFGEGHPLLGRRMPDLDLVTANGPLRVFTLLHDARPVLLNLGEPGGLDITPWADRVQLIDAKYVGTWELPAIGAVTALTAVLVRPDGYVAWVGDLTQVGLADALTSWFGPPTAA
jgi:3-(3-hydroxy-phenyl)propionate hydroxylase